jgi:predicted nucleotidyltransferase
VHKEVYEGIFGRDWSYEKMAVKADKAVKLVRKYIGELERNKIPIEKAILFGSYAKGYAKEESDIDVALVSEVFSGDRFEDRRKIIPLRRKIDSRIEPLPFKTEDFENGGILVEEIKKTGIVVFQR